MNWRYLNGWSFKCQELLCLDKKTQTFRIRINDLSGLTAEMGDYFPGL